MSAQGWSRCFRISPVIVALCLSTLVLGSLSPSVSSATVVRALNLETLSARATHIVHARVGSSIERSVENVSLPSRDLPAQRTRLHVLQYLKGEGPSEISLQQLGGRIGDVEVRIIGVAELKSGDEGYFFLRHDVERDLYKIVELSQGVFFVDPYAPLAAPRQRLDQVSRYHSLGKQRRPLKLRRLAPNHVARQLTREGFETQLRAMIGVTR